jgi:hypothetical protein
LLEILHYEIGATNKQDEFEHDIIDTEHLHSELVEFGILLLDSFKSLDDSNVQEEVQGEGEVGQEDVPDNSRFGNGPEEVQESTNRIVLEDVVFFGGCKTLHHSDLILVLRFINLSNCLCHIYMVKVKDAFSTIEREVEHLQFYLLLWEIREGKCSFK